MQNRVIVSADFKPAVADGCRTEFAGRCAPAGQETPSPAHKRLPILFLVGDSTVKNGTRDQQGWGERIGSLFDAAKIKVENRAIGGRSSRTFINEGRWDQILEAAQKGDFVIIQMGHNDGGSLDDPRRARGSLRGTGEETREIDNPITGKHEVVHTYGWYLRKYIADARAKGLTPILCSPIPHRPKEAVEAGSLEKSNHVTWSEEVAKQEGVLFINLNQIVRQHYVGLQPDEIKAKYFTPADDTHTNSDGAELNAACVVEGLRTLKDCPLVAFLKTDAPPQEKPAVPSPTNPPAAQQALLPTAVPSAIPQALLLWPNGAPGSDGNTDPELTTPPKENQDYTKVFRIHQPSITPFLPPPDKATGRRGYYLPRRRASLSGHRYRRLQRRPVAG